MKVKSIAIFASGKGTNADRLMHYFKDSPDISIRLVLSNRVDAGVLSIANNHKVNVEICSNAEIEKGEKLIALMQKHKIDYVVLSGFLRKIPAALINVYPGKIINIHPSLLPKHGGKGMYGDHVHEAVIKAQDKKTGITIHTIDERYDHGKQLAQFEVELDQNETISTVRDKVQLLEHIHFGPTVEKYIQTQKNEAD